MKVIIWGGCVVALSILLVLLRYAGVMLGGIPTGLLFFGMSMLAAYLCKRWDGHVEQEHIKKSGMPTVTKAAQHCVCNQCGATLTGNTHYCKVCGAQVPKIRVCAKCGAGNAKTAHFCLSCGAELVQ